MAHSLSAKKRIRQNEKRRAQNRQRKELLKTEIKAHRQTLTSVYDYSDVKPPIAP